MDTESLIHALEKLLIDYKDLLESYNHLRESDGWDRESLDDSAISAERIIKEYKSA